MAQLRHNDESVNSSFFSALSFSSHKTLFFYLSTNLIACIFKMFTEKKHSFPCEFYLFNRYDFSGILNNLHILGEQFPLICYCECYFHECAYYSLHLFIPLKCRFLSQQHHSIHIIFITNPQEESILAIELKGRMTQENINFLSFD